MRALTKSELISRVFERHPSLSSRDADMAVNDAAGFAKLAEVAKSKLA